MIDQDRAKIAANNAVQIAGELESIIPMSPPDVENTNLHTTWPATPVKR
jgi:hypothetical protein